MSDSLAKAKEMGLMEEVGTDQVVQMDTIEVPGTPFIIVEKDVNGVKEYFGVLGQHRLTEIYYDKVECEKDIRRITWDRIISVLYITLDGNDLLKK